MATVTEFPITTDTVSNQKAAVRTALGIGTTDSPLFNNNAITPQNYGLIADGTSNPLSDRYASLSAAQEVYPFASALTQEIDYCAVKAASDAAFGEDGSENAASAHLNRPLYLPRGRYMFGADTWTIRNAVGIHIYGDGINATTLTGSATVLAFDGLWYSRIEGMSIRASAATAVTALDIDGNVPGHAYATRGVQGNRFVSILVHGGDSTYAVTMCRLGGSGGQGSENKFEECFFFNATEAVYFQTGFNALQNTFVGGNFQQYTKCAIKLEAGSIGIYSVGFQSNTGYSQVLNGGYDIDCSYGGSYDRVIVSGCRTESPRFFIGQEAQPGVLIGNSQFAALNATWSANFSYSLNDVIVKINDDTGIRALYVVTTAGTSGSSEPTWDTGVITDGDVAWTETVLRVVDAQTQTLFDIGNSWWVGVTYGISRIKGLINSEIPTYADDAAADADTWRPSGIFYQTVAGGRAIFRKP